MYSITIEYNSCIGCAKCVAICPKVVYAMEDGFPVMFDSGNCRGCLSCVIICPTGCLKIEEW
ncbi:MAG: 4Fe-4S binding protein [Nitrospirae bacterium]|nr:4Fe-4S binding protein [Nitrospirota bacterium]